MAPWRWRPAAGLALLSLLLVAASAVEKGSLRLTSLPGVDVEWEGITLGKTDPDGVLWIRDIPPGDYTVKLTKSGYRQSTNRLTVAVGETALSLGLERLPSQPAVARRRSAVPPPPPAPRPEVERSETQASASAGPGGEPAAREPAAPAAAVPETVAAPRTGAADAPPPAARPPRLLLLAAVLLSAFLALAFGRAMRQRAAAKKMRPAKRRPRLEPPPAEPPLESEPPGFLRDLQQREEYADSTEPQIIEVFDVEIIDEEP